MTDEEIMNEADKAVVQRHRKLAFEARILKLSRLLSILSDKSGKEVRLSIIFHLIAREGSIEVEELRVILGLSRANIFGHLRRLYDVELISNPTRKKTIEASNRLMDLAPALINLYERI